jgi:hypothetical protein
MPLVIKRTGLQDYAPGGKARVRLLVIGGPGVGKTRWASYFPDPIYADCEQSLASIADRDMPNVTIKNSSDMLSLLAELKIECSKPEEQRTYRTLVIDTLDGFQRKLKDEWIQQHLSIGQFTGFEAWNYIDAKMQMLLTRMLNLDMNVVVNVHFSTKRGEGEGAKEYGLQLDGSVKDKVFNDFDLVGWLETEWVAENGVRVEKRNITFTRTPQREFLKDRLFISPPGQKGFPINFEERDYEQLFDKIVERMGSLKPSEDVGIIADYLDPSAVPTGAVVGPQDAGSGALPAQDPRDAPLEQFDKPTLMKMAREEGVEGIKANWIKADLVNALKAKRAGAPTPVVEMPADVVVPDAFERGESAYDFPTSAQPNEAPEVPAVQTETTATGVVVDINTGEVIDTTQDEAIANIQSGLGAEVIFDDKPADVPASSPTVVAFPFPESCGDCGAPLKDEPPNVLRITKVKYGLHLCQEDYNYRKTSVGGKPKEKVSN